MKKIFMMAGLAMAMAASLATAGVIEDFDSGALQAGWNTNAGTISAGAAHDGGYGLNLSSGTWMYNTSLTVSKGETLSVWLRPNSTNAGRFYFGFGADASGTQSLVAASNTNQLLFQNNAGYGFNNIATSAQNYTVDWYKAVVQWNMDDTAVGYLYGSDGVSLLNTLNVAGLSRSSGGIALRGFGANGWDVDTISIDSATVPEPASLALLGLGLTGLAFARRTKKT